MNLPPNEADCDPLVDVEHEITVLEHERQRRSVLVKDMQADYRDTVRALEMLYTKRYEIKRDLEMAAFKRDQA